MSEWIRQDNEAVLRDDATKYKAWHIAKVDKWRLTEKEQIKMKEATPI